MAINKNEIKVVLSEGLQQVGDISVSDRTATFKVKGITPGQKTIKVRYTSGGADSTKEITVNKVPVPGDLTAAKPSVEVGETVKLTQAFDAAPNLGEVEFVLPAGVVAAGSKQSSGTSVTLDVTINAAAAHSISTTFRGQPTSKSVTVTGTNPVIESVTTEHEAVDEQGEDTVTVHFNAAN